MARPNFTISCATSLHNSRLHAESGTVPIHGLHCATMLCNHTASIRVLLPVHNAARCMFHLMSDHPSIPCPVSVTKSFPVMQSDMRGSVFSVLPEDVTQMHTVHLLSLPAVLLRSDKLPSNITVLPGVVPLRQVNFQLTEIFASTDTSVSETSP